MRMNGIPSGGSYSASNSVVSGPLLPSPVELFQIREPEVYTLEIEIQMFRFGAATPELYRFSPVKLKVEHRAPGSPVGGRNSP
jgi:hypothetical protein